MSRTLTYVLLAASLVTPALAAGVPHTPREPEYHLDADMTEVQADALAVAVRAGDLRAAV
jgi:hypothetical protein